MAEKLVKGINNKYALNKIEKIVRTIRTDNEPVLRKGQFP